MAAATVESAFVLIDRASGPIRKIRRELRGMERDAKAAGRAMDNIGGPRAAADLEALASETRGVRQEVRGLPPDAGRADRAIRDLDRTVVRSGRSARQTSTYYSMLTDRTKLMAGAAVAALPVVQALGGATVALGGSLMGAGLGAGATGLAGGGVLAAGLGSVVAVAKPAQKALEEAWKAQDAYTKAVQEHGRTSKQAAEAQKALDRTYQHQPGLRRATSELRALNREWKELTAPGRREWFGLLGDLGQIGRRAAPRMARNANTATKAVRTSGTAQGRFLAGDFAQDTLSIFTRAFARDLPVAERSLENVEVVMGRVARASLPFFEEGVHWVEDTTAGWREQNKSITSLRRQVGGYVDDLKAWGGLTHSAFELAKDVLMGGRPAGRSTVEDLTDTLDRWDHWVDRNPEKIDRFFRNAVQDTEDIAGSVADIVHGLNDMATELRPLLGPLERLVSLFGGLSASLSPGAAATLLLGVRGLRNGIARGGAGGAAAAGVGGGAAAGGGGGLMPMIMGAGGTSTGARLAARGRATYAVGRELGASRWAAGVGAAPRIAGGTALRAGGAAGRFALPALAIGGLQGAFGAGGANQGDGWLSKTAWGVRNAAQGAAAMFGIGHPVMGTDERTNRGLSRATQFISQLPGGQAPTGAQARQASRALVPELDRAEQAAADAEKPNDVAEAMAYLKALREQARAYREIAKEAKHARDIDLNAQSREKADKLTQSFGTAFDRYDARMGPEKALDKTVHGVFDKMKGMRREGARILGENTLAWAQELADKNPALQGQVDWLTKHIERSFSKMGDRVKVVNGRILTGSRSQWKSIGAAITDPANKALAETSEAFRKLRAQAVGELEMMGFSHADALAVFKGVRSGKLSTADVNERTGTGQSKMASDANLARAHGYKAPIGDAWGADAHARGQNPSGTATVAATASGGNLMGAKPALGVYAQDAGGYGLHVSSGRRPGAITNAGNVSFHSSGDALDLAGAPGDMMRFAQHAASAYGPHLEELIYSPMGFSIKNGKRVPPYAVADHYDHVHIADTAPTGAGAGGASFGFSPDTAGPGMQQISLKAPKSGLGGLPGAIADAAMAGGAAGISQIANDALGGGMFAGGGAVSAGGQYDKSALASLWVQAGGDPSVANMAAAIALAESGGNPTAHNPSGATGLWQILGAVLPGNLYDPMVNARNAVAKWRAAHGFTPWTTYTGADTPGHAKTYQQYMGDGIGWARPRMTAHAASSSGGATRSGGGGRSPVVFAPQANFTGMDRAALRAELSKHLDAFIDMVEAEMLGGTEEEALA